MSSFSNSFVFCKLFEQNWQAIRQEYMCSTSRLSPFFNKDLYNHDWDVATLFTWPSGEQIQQMSVLCPLTTHLIKKYIPTHGTAAFSRVKANTEIYPHKGYQGNFLRFHLGLDVPEGECYIEVEGERKYWSNGVSFVFDDRKTHYVKNNTSFDRVILLVDFVPNELSSNT